VSEPQTAIIPEPSESALFLLLRMRPAPDQLPSIARTLAQTPRITETLAATDRRAKLVSAVSIGSGFWDVLSPASRPAGLRPFAPITADGRTAPATGGDLLFHVISRRHDLNFELALRLKRALGDAAVVIDEIHGFRYLDARDLTGFIDGTENPKGKARADVALIGAEDREFAGGSYVFTQRYVHDLGKWATVDAKQQERIIGRTKSDSKELSAKAKPPTAHISRVTIEEKGEELKIVRHSFPYGTVSEAGLFFIAYCRTLDIPERMLKRMLGAAGDGLHDRLMEFTTPVSGATFFAPSLSVLRSFPRRRLGRQTLKP
jgi:putative iron-dependent peroxidase